MTKATVDPGVCGFTAEINAVCEDGIDVRIQVETDCPQINDMMAELGDTFMGMDVCFKRPGQGPFYEYAAENFSGHATCVVISSILKVIEAEAGLALPRNTSLSFSE